MSGEKHIKIGGFSGNLTQILAMGKEAFIAAHQHVPEVEKVWSACAKAGAKEPAAKTEDKA